MQRAAFAVRDGRHAEMTCPFLLSLSFQNLFRYVHATDLNVISSTLGFLFFSTVGAVRLFSPL